MKRTQVTVSPASALQSRANVFGLLRELYSVNFVAFDGISTKPSAALLLEGAAIEEVERALKLGVDCLAVARPASDSHVPVKNGSVEFNAPVTLDPCFRGQKMVDELIKEFSPVEALPGDDVVCTLEHRPFWIERKVGRSVMSIVSLGLPDFQPGETVYEHFNRMRWLQFLPFLNFLKRLTAEGDWDPPALRACLMFDDPNLRRPSYGFVDFKQMAEHAGEHNYHASFAMVPFDCWGRENAAAVALFKDPEARLSLCMHGNNHAPIELGVEMNEAVQTGLLAQAMRRINSFEKRSGVRVARIMVPPHGAFRQDLADPMIRLGYEAVCVSRASLTAWNKDRIRPMHFGHPVSEMLNGLPVIPRHVMRRGHEGAYRMAAFLNQPIIPHGHHQDCKGGLDLLAHVAGAINAIGKVTWCDMIRLSRSNYLTKQCGDVLRVRMLSRRIELTIPECVHSLEVERPWIEEVEGLLCSSAGVRYFDQLSEARNLSVSAKLPGRVEICSMPLEAMSAELVPDPRPRPWLFTRRLLSEIRDRIVPILR